MNLSKVVENRLDIEIKIADVRKRYDKRLKFLNSKLSKLLELENIGSAGIDISKVEIAESIIRVSGDIYGRTSDVTKFGGLTIAKAAINDIATGCKHLKNQYFGNKTYGGFYQRCDCSYGMGPRHGGICDRIELKDRKRELTVNEKDACIYYLQNYNAIKAEKQKVKTA